MANAKGYFIDDHKSERNKLIRDIMKNPDKYDGVNFDGLDIANNRQDEVKAQQGCTRIVGTGFISGRTRQAIQAK